MRVNRRDFLTTASGATALGLGLNLFSPDIFKRRLLAEPILGAKKLLFIFQRGGMDGINACIPRGDSEYNTTNRPTLFVSNNAVQNANYGGTDLGNGFAQLHPRMAKMMDLYNNGELAVLHRIGYRGQSRSHFDSQQYWENGTRDRNLEVGMFNRFVQETIAKQGNTFPAAALSGGLMVALRGPEPIPNFSSAPKFRLRGTAAQSQKFLGRKDGDGGPGRGLLGFYTGTRSFPSKPYRDILYRTGVVLADTMQTLQANGIDPDNYVPEPGADYPGGSFGDKLKQAAQLFKTTSVQILGINIGGWDTHTKQDKAHNRLLYDIGSAFSALRVDLQDQWDDTLVITMTEFGRTSKENGSLGTDHAEAAVVFAAGGGVNPNQNKRVYNCDSSTWANGDIFSTNNGRYLAHRTDFRAVMAEIFSKHFGDSQSVIDTVIPTYQSAKGEDAAGFVPLNFLS